MRPKPPIPLWRWGLWWVALAVGMFIFYVLLTPIWLGLRVLAWAAEFRARNRSAAGQSPPARSG
jgi:hypothetical protein